MDNVNEVDEMAQLVKEWEDQLPPWAIKRAQPGVLEVGCQLPTKDGRRHGNATIIMASTSKHGGRQYYSLLTDAGNSIIMNSTEIFEGFHPARFIVDVAETLKKFDHNGEFSGPDQRGQLTD